MARGKVALALAGGGPEGAIYEIGALRALSESVAGLDLNQMDIYIGVSAGAFIAANLANRMTTAQMCRAIVKEEPGEHPFRPETFFQPAGREFFGRAARIPKLLREALKKGLQPSPDPILADALMRLGRALPVGIADNGPIREYLEKIYSIKGRTNDFRELDHQLYVVATELETGRAVRFGEPGWDHVPIAQAVQASTALPGMYRPVQIEGRYFVDGVLLKTLHASVALEGGAELVLCINPIVPVDLHTAAGQVPNGFLVERGLPTVLSQTFRTLIHSRLHVGLGSYTEKYPEADVVLFEPRRDDYRMFFTNIFTFSSRKTVCEHAYNVTRRQLLSRADELDPLLARHGMSLRRGVLEDTSRNLWEGVGVSAVGGEVEHQPTLARLDRSLDRLESLLAR
ncbi:MAG: patatin-like phospholipase family protein [Thermoanaerobaculia bacterium]|nr:patatin-like phospholipase family protein [Thermoanaerobaculia bacterium]